MDNLFTFQYQATAQPPAQSAQPGQTNAAPWLYAWSLPVRFKVLPAVAVVLAATSGGVLPPPQPTTINGISWYAPLNEPVRLKIGLGAHLQKTGFLEVPTQPVTSRLIQWFAPLSEPVRLKIGTPAFEQPFLFVEPQPPEAMEIPWYNWLSEPVRLPQGLKAWLQQTTAWEPRLLPPANVFVTMDALETNNDVALFGIQVYSSAAPSGGVASANVSIAEVPVENSASASLRES